MQEKKSRNKSEKTSKAAVVGASASVLAYKDAATSAGNRISAGKESPKTGIKGMSAFRPTTKRRWMECQQPHCGKRAIMTIGVSIDVPDKDTSSIDLCTRTCLGCGLFLYKYIPSATWFEDPDDPSNSCQSPEVFNRGTEESWN